MGSVARRRVAAVLLLWWVAVGAASARQPKDRGIALDQANTQGLVRAEFRGTGASTGDSILVKVTNLTTRPLALEITPGTLLRSQAADVQDMVVERVRGIPTGGGMFRPVSEISLAAKEWGTCRMGDGMGDVGSETTWRHRPARFNLREDEG